MNDLNEIEARARHAELEKIRLETERLRRPWRQPTTWFGAFAAVGVLAGLGPPWMLAMTANAQRNEAVSELGDAEARRDEFALQLTNLIDDLNQTSRGRGGWTGETAEPPPGDEGSDADGPDPADPVSTEPEPTDPEPTDPTTAGPGSPSGTTDPGIVLDAGLVAALGRERIEDQVRTGSALIPVIEHSKFHPDLTQWFDKSALELDRAGRPDAARELHQIGDRMRIAPVSRDEEVRLTREALQVLQAEIEPSPRPPR